MSTARHAQVRVLASMELHGIGLSYTVLSNQLQPLVKALSKISLETYTVSPRVTGPTLWAQHGGTRKGV